MNPSRSPLCEAYKEYPDHIFLHCQFSHRIWAWFYKKMNLSKVSHETILLHLLAQPIFHYENIFKGLWKISPSIINWEIWKERNRWIFKDKEILCEELTRKIEASIIETLTRKLHQKNTQMLSWDGFMQNKWIGFRIGAPTPFHGVLIYFGSF